MSKPTVPPDVIWEDDVRCTARGGPLAHGAVMDGPEFPVLVG